MPREIQAKKRLPLAFLIGQIALAIVVTVVNFYNISRHPDHAKFWFGMLFISVVLNSVGFGLLIWDRRGKTS
jgi:uncharacterized membrane protein AbrB (regulator of aidB expression)